MKKKTLIWVIISALAIVLIGIYFQVWQYIKPEVLKTYFGGFGVWTPIVYSLIYLVAVFIPHAGTTMTFVGSLLFDPLFGTALVITISSLWSIFPFLLTKKYLRKKVKARIEKSKYKKYLHKTNENSFMFVLYMRLIPIIPYELQNYIIGLVEISTPRFFIATFIGLLPGTFFIMYLGSTITDVQPIKIVILAIITVFAILLPILLKKYTKAKEILQLEENNKKDKR